MNLTNLVLFQFFGGASEAAAAVIVYGPFCFHQGVSFVSGGTQGMLFQPGGTQGVMACN